jgi:4-amino-4-deoxy-L-arabinose transferase-like glycosyltransferase
MAARLPFLVSFPAAARVLASRSSWLLVAAAIVAVSVVGLGHPLQNVNEGLYARIPVEMLSSGDFVIPTLNGVPYLEKPPLMYWITALAYAVCGVSEASARAAPVLGALLTFASVAWFARRRLATNADAYALAILVSAPAVVLMARTLLFDMLLTGLLSVALVTLSEALRRGAEARLLRPSAVALALAVLTKGLAPLLFYGAVAMTLVPSRNRAEARARLKRLLAPEAIALFLLIAVPWHVAASLREPAFAHFYFINEHVMRFLDRRVPHDYHTGPWWYYLPRLPAYLFPWTLLVFAPFVWRPAQDGMTRRFLLAWFLVPLVLFSLSKAKAPYYMVIGMPPLALLLGDALARRPSTRGSMAIVAAAWLAFLGVAASLDERVFSPYLLPPHRDMLLALAFGLAGAAFVSSLRREPLVAAALLGGLALPFAFLASQVVNDVQRSARAAAQEIARSGRPVLLFRDFERVSALPWYLNRNVGIVDAESADLWFGLQLRPGAGAANPSAAEFATRARAAPVWLVVEDNRRDELDRTSLSQELVPVARYGKIWLYGSRPLLAELRTRTDRQLAVHEGEARQP